MLYITIFKLLDKNDTTIIIVQIKYNYSCNWWRRGEFNPIPRAITNRIWLGIQPLSELTPQKLTTRLVRSFAGLVRQIF